MDDDPIESDELHAYRLAARTWLADNLRRRDEGSATDVRSAAQIASGRLIQARLHEAGYAGYTFPVEYGGQGLTLDHERIFLDEATAYETPPLAFGVSINILGGTLAAFGTPEQKQQHLPRILSGAELWLQLLSEPSGGSDLAGLLMSAKRDGDSFVVNGQKTWSSGAQFADYALCPVRTAWDVPKHRGISLLIVDLRAPGIEIRPIRQINGESHFCEEFFSDVIVPATNLVGEEHEGWRAIRGLLEIEHGWVGRGGARRVEVRRDASDLVAMAKARGLDADAGVRRKVLGMHVQFEVQKLVASRVSRGIELGKLPHGYGSLLKMGNDLVVQRGTELAMAMAGTDGVTWDASDPSGGWWAHTFVTSRSLSIAGGSAEIQRNNVSEKVLGLPREPSFDRDVPFNEVPHN